jgi:hypothetical protein
MAGAAVVLLVFLASLTWQILGRPGRIQARGKDEVARLLFHAKEDAQPLQFEPPTPIPSPNTKTNASASADRALIVARVEHEDVGWIEYDFPDWERSVQSIGRNFAKLRFYEYGSQKIDKGRIANAYLSYIIVNYYRLPSTLVFLNTDALDIADLAALKGTNLDLLENTVKDSGYTNLRCMARSGCRREYMPNREPPDEFRTLEVAISTFWGELFNATAIPDIISSPCCAQFAVSGDKVRERAVEEYLRYWKWLNKTTLNDDTAGLFFEYIWHILFGKEPEYCLEMGACGCEAYGRC